jgi:hypothetical protein
MQCGYGQDCAFTTFAVPASYDNIKIYFHKYINGGYLSEYSTIVIGRGSFGCRDRQETSEGDVWKVGHFALLVSV